MFGVTTSDNDKLSHIVKNNDVMALLDICISSKPENTKRAYAGDINRFMVKCGIGLNTLHKVKARELKQYIDYMKIERGLKNATINRNISALKVVFGVVSMVLGVENPFTMLSVLGVKTSFETDKSFNGEKALSGEEVRLILSHYKDRAETSRSERTVYTSLRNYILVSLLYYTGLRISEALNVKYEDIKKINNGVYGVSVVGKGDKPRMVLMKGELYKDVVCLNNDCTGYVFRSLKGCQLSRLSFIQDIKRLGKRLLGKHITPHIFRHSFATNLIEKTKDISKVSKYLGHTDINTTSKIYNHNKIDMSDIELLY